MSFITEYYKNNSMSVYVKNNPSGSLYRHHNDGDNPKKFFSYWCHLFYQENENEAVFFIKEREDKKTEMYAMIHLKLDLKNNKAYVDDVWSERWDDGELFEGDYAIVENKLFEINYVLSTIQYYFLGDIELIDNGERSKKLTGDDWDKYDAYRATL